MASSPALAVVQASTPGVGALPSASHAGHRCCQGEAPSGRAPLVPGQSGSRTLVGVSLDGHAIAVPLRCRSWRCECCARRLRARNQARAMQGAEGRVAFLTLTLDPSDGRWLRYWMAYRAEHSYTPALRYAGGHVEDDRQRAVLSAASIKYQQIAWNRLTARLRKRGWGVHYYRGVELHRSGMAHLHVIVRVADLVDFWALRSMLRGGWAEQAGFGQVVDMQLAKNTLDVARYVAKASNAGAVSPRPFRGSATGRVAAYVSKGLDQRMPRYARRGTWSKRWAARWAPPTALAGFTWRVAPLSVPRAIAALLASDFVIADPGSFRVAGGSTA